MSGSSRKSYWVSDSGQETLTDAWEWLRGPPGSSGVPPGCPGVGRGPPECPGEVVRHCRTSRSGGRPSQMSGSGRETLPNVQEWWKSGSDWETLPEVWEPIPNVREWSGDPPGCT